jgi:(4-(4-[2-(gamma-L-glutamylamino)ethyl]phenoxymethyl)furan-2-yl)methanamine synthase
MSSMPSENVLRVLGLDIGGANLKAADTDGKAVSRPFAVWKHPDRLAAEIGRLIAAFPRPDCIAVTMTAELADCYRTKREGVDAILSAVEEAACKTPVRVWQTSGRFVSAEQARAAPLLTAAANWHAIATFVSAFAPAGGALLIDIGSTTCDLIPLEDGSPMAVGRTDSERLQSRELIYTGVRRTPVCAIVKTLPFRGGDCPVAAELFATSLDAYLTTGDLPEDPSNVETADGRPATIACARDRLARCVCCDAEEFSREDAETAARALREAQQRQLLSALERVLGACNRLPSRIFISGMGGFLARRVVQACPDLRNAAVTDLLELFGPEVTEAACAFAVARLAATVGNGGELSA